MNLDTLSAQIAVALLGGVAAELLHWYALSRRPGGSGRFKVHNIYWVTTGGMVMLGGVMPLLYLQGTASALLCFHLGATAPVILQKLVANLPVAVANQGPDAPTLRDFFTW